MANPVGDGRIGLQLPAIGQAVVEHRGHSRAMVGVGFLFDDGSQLQRIIARKSCVLDIRPVKRGGLVGILGQHGSDNRIGGGFLVNRVRLGEQKSLESRSIRFCEEREIRSVGRSVACRFLELIGRDAAFGRFGNNFSRLYYGQPFRHRESRSRNRGLHNGDDVVYGLSAGQRVGPRLQLALGAELVHAIGKCRRVFDEPGIEQGLRN